jgi:dolichyl-phosphate beta-glucosyltransferase
MGPDVYLSIIIPAYKCGLILEKNLPDFITHLKSLNINYEIVVVDDGSNDGGLIKNVAEKSGCRYLASPANKGKGAAIKLGIKESQGKFKLFTDADIPYEYEAIATMLHYLDEKEFDMVVGDRKMHRSIYYEDMSWLRNIGSKVFSAVVGLFIVGGWYDTQCGIKAFRKESADTLFGLSKINGFAMDVELFYLALKRDYDIKRISVKLRSTDGKSVRLLKHGILMVADLLRILFFQLSGKYRV